MAATHRKIAANAAPIPKLIFRFRDHSPRFSIRADSPPQIHLIHIYGTSRVLMSEDPPLPQSDSVIDALDKPTGCDFFKKIHDRLDGPFVQLPKDIHFLGVFDRSVYCPRIQKLGCTNACAQRQADWGDILLLLFLLASMPET